ncbi:MepB family protein [Staphylococcus haemolyticus]|uniref:MepB family protein n=5 Tax=Staphylococcus haemolyticus TaxID=1283 RepID=UPI001E551E7C|nr:MepB family protein [Staphylococcus haemolyticus]MCC3663167.1 MepB family protein [Staphylococcus haemolyticus]MDT4239947.1 MepB family protein [Staphylococcus haemolyticus]MDT4298194.1 MepB family protein [Staphylococcus haemolyticus]MDT4317244.1 MepB family protein [Staphylococcus haemolyticus]MDT4353637.1 MepB family protein [Staphylococcus haemolyticus]
MVANNYRGNCAFFLFKNIKIGLMNFVISPIYYRTFKSRLAQKTPNKKGYFFAMWKKDENHTNIPFTEDDLENQLIVNIVDDNRRGQFIFPKDILIKKGILKSDDSKGKMALRVYPPWETELNKTAAKTQAWQCAYFNEIVHE